MKFLNSFCICSNGLFDFDITFFLQALIFFLFSLIITNIFLLPISENLKKRSNLISLTNQKSVIYLNLIFEKISLSLNLFKSQKNEITRELRIYDNYIKQKFSSEQKIFEDNIFNFIIKLEKSFFFKSIYLLSNLTNYIDKTLKNRTEF